MPPSGSAFPVLQRGHMLPGKGTFPVTPKRPCRRAKRHLRCPQGDYAAARIRIPHASSEAMLPGEGAFPVLPASLCCHADPHFPVPPVRPCCRTKAHFRCPQRGHAAERLRISGAPARPYAAGQRHISGDTKEAMPPGEEAFAVPPGRLCCRPKPHFSCFERGHAAGRRHISGASS